MGEDRNFEARPIQPYRAIDEEGKFTLYWPSHSMITGTSEDEKVVVLSLQAFLPLTGWVRIVSTLSPDEVDQIIEDLIAVRDLVSAPAATQAAALIDKVRKKK